MPFLIGPMCKKLRSEKYLTDHNEIFDLDSEIIALALTVGSQTMKPLVNVGDYVSLGQMVALRDDRFYVPLYSSCSGEVIGIEKRMSARLTPCDYLIIKNDFKDTPLYLDKLVSLDSTREEIIDFMKRIGLLGQGGAGFPAYAKFNTDKCDTLIINAVECEPYLTADYQNVVENIYDFRNGVRLMLKASGAKKCLIAIKAYHKDIVGLLRLSFREYDNIIVSPVRDVYPMGWERTLVKELTKKSYSKLPIEAGAIVANATSAITLAQAIKNKLPMYQRIVTLAGENVKNPHNVRCRIGTSVHDLIEKCGGVKEYPANILMGGPMMGSCITKDDVTINSISNSITIYKHENITPMSCLRCGRCVEHCPSSLQPCSINEAFKIGDVARLEHLHLMDCVECGMCTYVCPSKIEVTEGIRRAKRFYNLRRKV